MEFVAIDFLEPLESIIAKIEPFCKEVTHAYFTSYVHNDDFDILKEKNVPLFENFLRAIDTVARNSLQRVCLQTGGKVGSFRIIHFPINISILKFSIFKQNYGVEKGPIHAPTSEDLTPRSKDDKNFYHPQEDIMFALEKQRKWKHNIIRPQSIIGFTPGRKWACCLKFISQARWDSFADSVLQQLAWLQHSS